MIAILTNYKLLKIRGKHSNNFSLNSYFFKLKTIPINGEILNSLFMVMRIIKIAL